MSSWSKLKAKSGPFLFNSYLILTSYYFFKENFCELIWTDGYSMIPTISPNQLLLTEHVSVERKKIKRGDIVILKGFENPKEYLCKRVIALQGDIIQDIVVPKGHIWLEGDNKKHSHDSRKFGPVPYGLVTNKVLFSIWPIYNMKNLTN